MGLTLLEAYEQLVARIHRDFNFDASESAPPEDEYWATTCDNLVRFAEELDSRLEAGGLR